MHFAQNALQIYKLFLIKQKKKKKNGELSPNCQNPYVLPLAKMQKSLSHFSFFTSPPFMSPSPIYKKIGCLSTTNLSLTLNLIP